MDLRTSLVMLVCMILGCHTSVRAQTTTYDVTTVEVDHYHDLACSDVAICYCYITGYDYAAECSDQNTDIVEIPQKLSYNITVLKMYRTQIRTVEAEHLEPYLSLRVIDLSQNQLATISQGFLDAYPNLEEFYVYINNLASLPANLLAGKSNLLQLRGEYNQLTQLPNLRELRSLTYVNFGYNSITSLQTDLFTGCDNMRELYLSNNKITNLQGDSFKGLSGLQTLDLSRNEITNINTYAFRGLTTLVTVYLNNNKLENIPAGIFQSSGGSLNYLDISGNRLSSIDNSAFATLSNLFSLHLGSNRLSTVPDALNSLTGLATLNLRNNSFSTIGPNSFNGLTTLRELFLDDMSSLSSVDFQAFRGLVQLKRLSLGNNPALHEFTPQHLSGLEHPNLEEVYLHRCGFTFLDELIFSDKPTLSYVDIYGNAFNCSCDLKWMTRVVADEVAWAKHWAASSTPPTCYTPEHIQDWPIPSMVESDMTCVPLTIEPISPFQQTIHLRSRVNFTNRLYNGLPASLWYIPNQQEPVVPYPGGDVPMTLRVYATWRVRENNVLESTLFLDNSSTTDQGIYRIVATNIMGNSTMDFSLNVLPYELTTTPVVLETTGYISRGVTWSGSTYCMLGLLCLSICSFA